MMNMAKIEFHNNYDNEKLSTFYNKLIKDYANKDSLLEIQITTAFFNLSGWESIFKGLTFNKNVSVKLLIGVDPTNYDHLINSQSQASYSQDYKQVSKNNIKDGINFISLEENQIINNIC